MNSFSSNPKTFLIAGLALSLVLPGCAQNYGSAQQAANRACTSLGPRATSGAVIGAVAGAATGAAIGAAAGSGNGSMYGALAGLLVGSLVGLAKGKQLDKRDCEVAQAALQKIETAQLGDSITWNSPYTGSSGLFKPVSEVYAGTGGQPCRRIQADYYMKDHQPVQGDTGIVCRTSDGNWVRQNGTEKPRKI